VNEFGFKLIQQLAASFVQYRGLHLSLLHSDTTYQIHSKTTKDIDI